MAKKEDLMNGFGTRINEGSPALRKRPSDSPNGERSGERKDNVRKRGANSEARKGSQTYTYTSLALDDELYAKIRRIADDNSLPYRDIVNAAFRKYVELYEAKHGPVQTPRESHISADALI